MISYDAFAARWDQEDESGILHQLVDRFDGQGLVLKTDAQSPDTPQGGAEQPNQVSQMAKRATKLGK